MIVDNITRHVRQNVEVTLRAALRPQLLMRDDGTKATNARLKTALAEAGFSVEGVASEVIEGDLFIAAVVNHGEQTVITKIKV